MSSATVSPGSATAPTAEAGDSTDPLVQERQAWMAVLAKAAPEDMEIMETVWAELSDKPEVRMLRPPETGLVMVQARAGGRGRRFNMGEMTMTRCAVQVDRATGFGYVAGRRPRHAELAALFDGLLQDKGRRQGLMDGLVEPLRERAEARHAEAAAKSAATKVEFFTMVRGED